MSKFYQITAIVYKKLEHSQNDPNKIDKTYEIIVHSQYIHNLQVVEFNDSKNRTYYRYQIALIANNNISVHYISQDHYTSLKNAINTDFGITEIN